MEDQELYDKHHGDMLRVITELKDLDKRLAVIETKQHMASDWMVKFELEFRDLKDGQSVLLKLLNEHVLQEDKDRAKMLMAVIGILVTTLSSFAVAVWPILVDHFTK